MQLEFLTTVVSDGIHAQLIPTVPFSPSGSGSGPRWAPWSPWSSCSSQCLRGESQARHRACLDGAGGSAAEEIKPCIVRGGGQKANVDIRLCACNRYTVATEHLMGSIL